ncbi:unnamed protein product, partial [Allacma fusca]
MPKKNRKSVATMSSFVDEAQGNDSSKDQGSVQLDSLCENLLGKMTELMNSKFADIERKLKFTVEGENQGPVTMVTRQFNGNVVPNRRHSDTEIVSGADNFANTPIGRFANFNRPEIVNLDSELVGDKTQIQGRTKQSGIPLRRT